MASNREKNLADEMYRTFATPHGKTVLWWILDQCGMFAGYPEQINPALLSFANRLLREMGAFSPSCAGSLMEALVNINKPSERDELEGED